jgi:hypothetical protein
LAKAAPKPEAEPLPPLDEPAVIPKSISADQTPAPLPSSKGGNFKAVLITGATIVAAAILLVLVMVLALRAG